MEPEAVADRLFGAIFSMDAYGYFIEMRLSECLYTEASSDIDDGAQFLRK